MYWWGWKEWLERLEALTHEELGVPLQDVEVSPKELEDMFLDFEEPEHAIPAIRELYNSRNTEGVMVF